MKKKKNIFIEQFDNFSFFLKELSDNDIVNLESEKKEIKFEIINKSDKTNKTKVLSFDEFTAQAIIEELNKLSSRDEGYTFLISKCFTRTDYETIVQILDIPFQKKDTIERIKEKIIEGTIGFRLRSQAIQGKKNDV